MNAPKPTRRNVLMMPLALSAFALGGTSACADDQGNASWPADVHVPSNAQPTPQAFTPARSVSLTSCGGSTSSSDNSAALTKAFQQAGSGGEVTVPAGSFAVANPVNWPTYPVRLRGLGSNSEPSKLAFGKGVVHGLGVRGKGMNGSWVSNLTFTGTSSAQLFVQDSPGQQFVVDRCTFVDAPTFGIQVENAYLYVTGSHFVGPADGSMTAVHAMKSGTKVTATETTITGCFRGLYCGGVGDLSAKKVTVDALWWCGNPTKTTTTLASATANSVTLKDAVKPPQASNYTVTAWKKITDSATLTPLSGKAGWYTLQGASGIEPRLMLRTKDTWGTVLEASGNQVRVAAFYDWSTCHPKPAPSKLTGVTVERPYIGSVTSLSGPKATLKDRWKAGAKSTIETPPVGARVTVVPALDYQVFGTDGTQSFSAVGCTVRNSWADSISTIASSNAHVANNDIWDSQDVGITIQQGKGACRVENNTLHRIGTAAVFIGTSSAQVTGNTVNGAQHTAYQEDSYAALQVEGAEKVAVWKNTVVWGGSPFEIRALLLEGRYGPFPQKDPSQGPFATGGFYKQNTFRGYPKDLTIPVPSTESSLKMVEVTARGPHVSAASADWGDIRIQALDGAEKSKIKA